MAYNLSASGWRMLAWLAGSLLLALLVGWAMGHVGGALVIVLALWLSVSTWRLFKFDRWLRHRRMLEPPDYEGVWGDIVAVTTRLDRRKQFHKQRVTNLLREFRRLTSAMPDGAVLLNADHEIVWFNERAAQWLQLKRRRDIGVRIENLVRHPEFIDYLRSVQNDEAVDEPPVIPMAGNGQRFVSMYLVTTRDTPQRLLIVRDVTHQVRLENMRKEFVANASHELRSPLTVVSGYLDAIADSDEAELETWREPVAEMRRQTERMRGIIDDLLELSRLEGHQETAGSEPVDVAGLLAVIRKDALAAPSHPAAIELKLESRHKVRGVERELASAFGNLMNNAVKYTPANGAIEIRYWTDREGAHVSVRDTGIGIAPEHLPRLTERFYRIDTSRARELGGSGLGLAIVKHVLQRHEAQLEVQSEPGKGSTFTCHFPAKRVVL